VKNKMGEQKYPDYWSQEKRREYNKDYRVAHLQHIKELQRKWLETHREQHNDASKRWNKKHPERYNRNRKRPIEQWRAQNYVQRHPELLGTKCELCGSTENPCGHHPDYSFPHIIVTTCQSFHKWIHKGDENINC